MIIQQIGGKGREVKLSMFAALDGWEIQNKYVEFAMSSDKAFRREFTMEVLQYAHVILDSGQELPLSTDALIDNHLQTWENVHAVFRGVLLYNGINPDTHAEKPHYWANAGAEMAVSFIAECAKLMGPGLQAVNENMLNAKQG